MALYNKIFKVAGVTFANNDGTERQDILEELDLGLIPPEFTLETTTYKDEDAIIVYVSGYQVGFIPRVDVPWLMKHFDEAEAVVDYEVVGGDGYSYGLRLTIQFYKPEPSKVITKLPEKEPVKIFENQKIYSLVETGLVNDDGSSRQTLLQKLDQSAKEPSFRFDKNETGGKQKIDVYADGNLIGCISPKDTPWLIANWELAESIASYNITCNNGMYSISLDVAFADKEKAELEADLDTDTVICAACGKKTPLEKCCEHCNAKVIHTGGGVFLDWWPTLLAGYFFATTIYSFSNSSAFETVINIAVFIISVFLSVRLRKIRRSNKHCAIVEETFRFRLWYLAYLYIIYIDILALRVIFAAGKLLSLLI